MQSDDAYHGELAKMATRLLDAELTVHRLRMELADAQYQLQQMRATHRADSHYLSMKLGP